MRKKELLTAVPEIIRPADPAGLREKATEFHIGLIRRRLQEAALPQAETLAVIDRLIEMLKTSDYNK